MPKESVIFQIADLSHSHDPKEIKKGISHFHGVIDVSVSLKRGEVAVDYDNTGLNSEKIAERIEKLGFSPKKAGQEEHIM